MKLLVVSVLVLYLTISSASNIAMFMTIGSQSHINLYTAFAKILIDDGHNITFFNTVMDTKFPNFTSVLPKEFLTTFKRRRLSLFQERLDHVLVSAGNYYLFEDSIELCQIFLGSEEWKNVINSDVHFDLVVINPLFAECGLVLGHHYKAPVVYLATSGIYPRTNLVFANPSTILYRPDTFTRTSQNVLDFSQRFYSSLTLFSVRFLQLWYQFPKTEEILREHFGPGVPSITEMEQNVSLFFVNSNIGVDLPAPYMPNVIEIAGIHCQPANPLPKEFSEFVENSSGIILFSLGSLVKAADMPLSFRNALLDAFSQLPYKVIWKWDDEQMDGVTIPNNVMITKWMPQNDLLGHNKTKLFITHGGKQSTIEALYHVVPVVVIPIFADQELYAFLAQERGYGVIFEVENLGSSKIILEALKTVLSTEQFANNAKKYSSIMEDQPLTSRERVSYWTNYVIRHKGIPLMKFPARRMHWIQYYQVDVVVSLLVILAISVTICGKMFVLMLKKLKGNKI